MGISLTAPAVTRTLSIERTNLTSTWAFDLEAIARACEHLSIRKPVSFGLRRKLRHGGLCTIHATYCAIGIQAHFTPERASEMVWHELTHAAQDARGERCVTGEVLRTQGRDAYWRHPQEIEARANERNHDWLPLVIA